MRLEKVPADSPLVNQTRMLKGLCLRELGQLDVARQLLADAYVDAGDSPLAAEILFQRAQIEQLDRKKDLASQMFLDLADRWPQDKHVADSLFNVAELKMELRDLDGAQRTLQRLNTDFPASGSEVRVKILQARILLSDRNPKEASQMLAAAIATEGISDRDRLLGSYHLIRAYHMARQFEQVVSVFEPIQADIMQPSSSDFYGAIALAAMSSLELKQYEKAQKFADDFLRLESGSENVADGLAARAVASSQLKQFDKAKLDLQRLAKDYSENPQTWLALLQCAEAAWALEEFRFSAEFFEMAATRKEDVRVHEPALAGAAWSRYRLKQYDQAAEMFEQSANAYPKSAGYSEVTYMAGMSRYEEGKLPEAEALFKSAFEGLEKDVAEDPNHPDAKYAYDAGRMYAKLAARDPDVANQIWDRVVKTFAKSGSLDTLLDEWAYFNLSINNFAQSDAIYRRLLSDIPGSKFAGQARLSLAESDMLANRFDQALSEFQAISDGEAYRTQEKEAALYHVVDILAARREWPEVLASAIRFKEQFPTSPRVPKVRLFEAEALLDQKRLAEAGQSLQLLRQAVIENQISPEPWTERIWVVLADAALADKRYSDVDGFADELKQRVPDSVFQFQMQLTQGLRWKSQAEPDLEKARAFFKLVTQDPRGRGSETAARSQFLIAETFVLQNDLKSASKEYYRVLLYPFDEWRVMALFQAAGCEQELGNTEAAVKNYEDLIRDFPDSSLLEQAKERLATLKK